MNSDTMQRDYATSTPLSSTLGIRQCSVGSDCVSLVLPPNNCSLELSGDRISLGGAIVLADHALGSSVMVRQSVLPRLSTVDLRIDWLCDLEPGQPLHIKASAEEALNDFYLAQGILTHAPGGNPVARAVGTFLAIWPNNDAAGFTLPDKEKPSEERSNFRNFDDLMRLSRTDSGFLLRPSAHQIGSPDIPALHGGIICAAMAAAADITAHEAIGVTHHANLAMRFLRPGHGKRPMFIRAEPDRIGRRLATYTVTAWQGEAAAAKIIAKAEYLYRRSA